jgi:hypothetical protein
MSDKKHLTAPMLRPFDIDFGRTFLRQWFLVLLAMACAFTSAASGQTVSPAMSSRDIEKKVSSLLAHMTLAEKLGQLQQLDGTWEGDARPEDFELARKGAVGSMIFIRGAKRTTELQRVAVNESRLKIPVLFAFDVIHGYRTIFPVPLGEAASWDPSGAERAASIAAEEASASGVRWTLAPMVDIARDPRWGRIVEGAGEDPFLGMAMAAARAKLLPAPNTGWPMERRRAGGITTPPKSPSERCVKFTFRPSRQRSMPVLGPS